MYRTKIKILKKCLVYRTKNGEKIYIQVAYILFLDQTIDREFGVFSEVTDGYPKYVISIDKFDMARDGIKHVNIIDFLLNELQM